MTPLIVLEYFIKYKSKFQTSHGLSKVSAVTQHNYLPTVCATFILFNEDHTCSFMSAHNILLIFYPKLNYRASYLLPQLTVIKVFYVRNQTKYSRYLTQYKVCTAFENF